MMLPSILLLLAAAAQSPAYARFAEQTDAAVPPPPAEAVRAEALATLQGNARTEGRCVPTGVAIERLESASAVRAVAEGVRDRQVKNGWTAYGRASGCPTPFLGHFFVLRLADDSLRVFIVNEGETLTNPTLMRDTAALAATAATNFLRRSDPSCTGEDMRMGPTRVVARSRDLGLSFHGAYFAGSWSEAWTFLVCGRRVEIPVSFTTDGEGGANYDIRGTEARILD